MIIIPARWRMTSEPSHDQTILLKLAGSWIPGRPSVPTLFRWSLRGVRGVRLETWLVGGRRFTSRDAIARFIAAINHNIPTQPRAEAPGQDAVDQMLDHHGY
jgi:hypothetical protein